MSEGNDCGDDSVFDPISIHQSCSSSFCRAQIDFLDINCLYFRKESSFSYKSFSMISS